MFPLTFKTMSCLATISQYELWSFLKQFEWQSINQSIYQSINPLHIYFSPHNFLGTINKRITINVLLLNRKL